MPFVMESRREHAHFCCSSSSLPTPTYSPVRDESASSPTSVPHTSPSSSKSVAAVARLKPREPGTTKMVEVTEGDSGSQRAGQRKQSPNARTLFYPLMKVPILLVFALLLLFLLPGEQIANGQTNSQPQHYQQHYPMMGFPGPFFQQQPSSSAVMFGSPTASGGMGGGWMGHSSFPQQSSATFGQPTNQQSSFWSNNQPTNHLANTNHNRVHHVTVLPGQGIPPPAVATSAVGGTNSQFSGVHSQPNHPSGTNQGSDEQLISVDEDTEESSDASDSDTTSSAIQHGQQPLSKNHLHNLQINNIRRRQPQAGEDAGTRVGQVGMGSDGAGSANGSNPLGEHNLGVPVAFPRYRPDQLALATMGDEEGAGEGTAGDSSSSSIPEASNNRITRMPHQFGLSSVSGQPSMMMVSGTPVVMGGDAGSHRLQGFTVNPNNGGNLQATSDFNNHQQQQHFKFAGPFHSSMAPSSPSSASSSHTQSPFVIGFQQQHSLPPASPHQGAELCQAFDCLNGGRCTVGDDNSHPFCLCPTGFSGAHCEVDVCTSITCPFAGEGGQRCRVRSGRPTCECVDGPAGERCRQAATHGSQGSNGSTHHAPSSSTSSSPGTVAWVCQHECLNGGRCVRSGNNENQHAESLINPGVCQCASSFAGANCNIRNPCADNTTCAFFGSGASCIADTASSAHMHPSTLTDLPHLCMCRDENGQWVDCTEMRRLELNINNNSPAGQNQQQQHLAQPPHAVNPHLLSGPFSSSSAAKAGGGSNGSNVVVAEVVETPRIGMMPRPVLESRLGSPPAATAQNHSRHQQPGRPRQEEEEFIELPKRRGGNADVGGEGGLRPPPSTGLHPFKLSPVDTFANNTAQQPPSFPIHKFPTTGQPHEDHEGSEGRDSTGTDTSSSSAATSSAGGSSHQVDHHHEQHHQKPPSSTGPRFPQFTPTTTSPASPSHQHHQQQRPHSMPQPPSTSGSSAANSGGEGSHQQQHRFVNNASSTTSPAGGEGSGGGTVTTILLPPPPSSQPPTTTAPHPQPHPQNPAHGGGPPAAHQEHSAAIATTTSKPLLLVVPEGGGGGGHEHHEQHRSKTDERNGDDGFLPTTDFLNLTALTTTTTKPATTTAAASSVVKVPGQKRVGFGDGSDGDGTTEHQGGPTHPGLIPVPNEVEPVATTPMSGGNHIAEKDEEEGEESHHSGKPHSTPTSHPSGGGGHHEGAVTAPPTSTTPSHSHVPNIGNEVTEQGGGVDRSQQQGSDGDSKAEPHGDKDHETNNDTIQKQLQQQQQTKHLIAQNNFLTWIVAIGMIIFFLTIVTGGAFCVGRYVRRSRRLHGKYNPAREESAIANTYSIPMTTVSSRDERLI